MLQVQTNLNFPPRGLCFRVRTASKRVDECPSVNENPFLESYSDVKNV